MFESGNEPKTLSESEIMELKKKHGIVLFYMNGCGHCETMKPTWNKLITELKDKHKNEIILGAIESSNMDMFKKHGISPSVSGFPTILYFHPNKGSNHESYNGDRSYEDLKKWILNKKGKVKGNKPIVILTNYNPNNNRGMGMGRGKGKGKGVVHGLGKQRGLAFSQFGGGGGGGTRRHRNTRRKSHTRRKTLRRRHRR
jgi:thiol-disulfide isomerase/thioredoxin